MGWKGEMYCKHKSTQNYFDWTRQTVLPFSLQRHHSNLQAQQMENERTLLPSQRIMGVKYAFPANQRISSECLDLVARIFNADPIGRITMADIRRHPWFLKNLPAELSVGCLSFVSNLAIFLGHTPGCCLAPFITWAVCVTNYALDTHPPTCQCFFSTP